MTSKPSKRLLSEAKSFYETEYLQRKQQSSYFNFLESLSLNRFNSPKIAKRFKSISKILNEEIKSIPDEVLKAIYNELANDHRYATSLKHPSSAYYQTPQEKVAVKNILEIFKENPERYKDVQLLPTFHHPKNPIGSHVPDILLLNISRRGTAATIIEVDDLETHRKKYRKDNHYYDEMNGLKIQVLTISNEQALNLNFLRTILSQLEPHESKDQKLKGARLLRKLYCYTIGSLIPIWQLTHKLRDHGVKLDLELILSTLSQQPTCPRKIKTEAGHN